MLADCLITKAEGGGLQRGNKSNERGKDDKASSTEGIFFNFKYEITLKIFIVD